jgi:hypothetical protein
MIWASIIFLIFIPLVGGFNYLVDPYGLNNSNYFGFDMTLHRDKIRLIKAIKTKQLKPTSICLGTSRVEYGCNPEHKYFIKPSYNLGIAGASLYEILLNFQNALKQGRLKKVLLVADYRMFNSNLQKSIIDYESYFENQPFRAYLFSFESIKDSLLTIKGGVDEDVFYLKNGQIDHIRPQRVINKKGGHLKIMKIAEKNYYNDMVTNYTYKDTKNKSFLDFEKILELSYQNDIELDIIFGPSHIRQWEALNYHLGYDKWLKWKKDVLLSVNKIASQKNKKQFRVMDFSVYHDLTSKQVPTDKDSIMQYYFDSGHYKNKLGEIVLDRLVDDSNFKDFGIELNLYNIDEHLKQQMIKRNKFIDIKKYQTEVFGTTKS